MPSSAEIPLPALHEEQFCLKSRRRTTGASRKKSFGVSFPPATRAGEGDSQAAFKEIKTQPRLTAESLPQPQPRTRHGGKGLNKIA